MRILLLNQEYPPLEGGAGNASWHLAGRLAARGHAVCVVTTEQAGPAPVLPGVQVTRVPVAGWTAGAFNLRALHSFAARAEAASVQLLKEQRPDVALAFFSWPGGAVARALRRRHGLPYVVALRGSDVPGFRLPARHPAWWWGVPLVRRVWRDATAVVANSEALRALARASWSGAIEVVPNGVDTARFAPAEFPRDRSPPRVLTVAQLVPRKRVDVLIRAWPRIRKGCDARLRIVGRGRVEAALRRLCAAVGVEDSVDFVGALPPEAMPALYREADVLVLLSEREGMANVLLEGMASGLACVSSRAGDAATLLQEGACGRLVEPEPEAVADAVLALLRDGAERARLGAAARMRVARDFTWDAVAASYEALLDRSCRGGECRAL